MGINNVPLHVWQVKGVAIVELVLHFCTGEERASAVALKMRAGVQATHAIAFVVTSVHGTLGVIHCVIRCIFSCAMGTHLCCRFASGLRQQGCVALARLTAAFVKSVQLRLALMRCHVWPVQAGCTGLVSCRRGGAAKHPWWVQAT